MFAQKGPWTFSCLHPLCWMSLGKSSEVENLHADTIDHKIGSWAQGDQVCGKSPEQWREAKAPTSADPSDGTDAAAPLRLYQHTSHGQVHQE